ncbi:hypothetical protein SAMN05443661_11415 [Natronobacterium gregoryi]|uniref:Uncharacterized protein n=2 Tax=Natronobacterium gregoryi TaxID=44930 RepID=L0AHB0_NATGS|nr:hypothetical protein Natgr_1619 [Natronobacterium gregoryi SP2]ELY69412.1 hypothetical protein C490_07809 [Natronobacterium gregoryi SP2]PLK21162.1 hypothetical protein CYV19_05900 [Natronobacterium gregoryi SP2]SFJ09900.1 hypothetical protein SAMN05443661_11415 [Natronobacterium gregoryi]
MASRDSSTEHSRIEGVLLLCLGLALVGYGVGQRTDTIEYSVPGVVSLVGGTTLLVWGAVTALPLVNAVEPRASTIVLARAVRLPEQIRGQHRRRRVITGPVSVFVHVVGIEFRRRCLRRKNRPETASEGTHRTSGTGSKQGSALHTLD